MANKSQSKILPTSDKGFVVLTDGITGKWLVFSNVGQVKE